MEFLDNLLDKQAKQFERQQNRETNQINRQIERESNKLLRQQDNVPGVLGTSSLLTKLGTAGAIIGGTTSLINKFGEKEASINPTINNTAGSAFTGITNEGERSLTGLQNLFSKKKRQQVAKKEDQYNQLLAPSIQNSLLKSTNSLSQMSNYTNKINNTGQITLSKEGSKLLSKEELSQILNKTNITFLQDGGSILIPDGALHANKHHMEEVNPELAKELTKKGIPVVITDEEGNVNQCAEIEKEELTFEKGLTDKVEALWKKGDEDSMIKCGKLITDTLFNNCDANTDLIERTE